MNTSLEDQARLVLGDTEGWPLAPVVDWLFREGCKTNDSRALLEGLAKILNEVGAPIWRLRLAFWTIHPLLAAYAHQWTSDGAIQDFKVGHNIFQSEAWIGSPAEYVKVHKQPLRRRLDDNLDPETDHSVLFTIRDSGGTDYFAVPMISFNGQVDSFFVTTNNPGGFTDGDLAKFETLTRYLLPVIESISQHRLSIALLDTYVGERTGRRVLEGRIKRGDGEVIDAALWFSDLREFTRLSETLEADQLLEMLNSYFEFVYNAVQLYEGEVLRFIGDAMLIVFPTDKSGGQKRACEYALAAAEDAFSGLATLNHRRRRHGDPEIRFGVGLHVGKVIYGNVGAPSRLDFTVMGPAVNRTARLESLTKETGTPLLMSGEFADRIDRPTRNLGAFAVKGIEQPLTAFALEDGFLIDDAS